MFAHHFDGGSPAEVVAALTEFQNDDGGFGHGLEADHHTPTSSVLSTNQALEYLRAAGVGTGAMIQGAIDFLVSGYEPDIDAWRIVPADVEAHPHAPWWEGRAEDPCPINPKMETLGHLLTYRDALPGSFMLDDLLARAIAGLPSEDGRVEHHELLCCLSLAETPALDPGVQAALEPRLLAWIDALVERNPAAWDSYCLKPLDVASTADSPYAKILADCLPANVDYELRRQNDDGSWSPHWTWYGDRYPDAWERARIHWAGIITLRITRRLSAHGVLD